MAGYIGSRASVVSSGSERKKTFAITTTTTALTGLPYTPTFVHVFHNGVRLVDGTDYTATNGTSITLTSAAESGDEVVVISYATFQVSDTVSASAGGTFAGDVNFNSTITADGLVVSANVPVIEIASANNQSGRLEFSESGDTIYSIEMNGTSGTSQDFTIYHDVTSASTARFQINQGGDISFYEDTGTTQKMVWKAADKELIVGSSSGAGGAGLTITSSSGDAIGYVLARGANGLTTQHRYLNKTSGGANIGGAVGHIGDTGLILTGSTTSIDVKQDVVIDSSGNLLVATTDASPNTVAGAVLQASGIVFSSATSAGSVFNRLSTDGGILSFRKDGTTVGSIGSYVGDVYWSGATGAGIKAIDATNRFYPCTNTGVTSDNTHDWGYGTARWNDIYATNGTIQTSDRNEKQDIEALSDAEQRVAVACKGLLRKFRWKDAVAEKGDDARIHFGIIAQDLQAAFEVEGLDAGRYAMFISSTWWETQTEVPAVAAVAEVLDEDGNVVTEAVEAKEAYTRTDTYETLEEAPEGATERTRLGVRYPELLAFIIGAM